MEQKAKTEKCPHENSHDGLPCGHCGKTTNSPTVPADVIEDQKIKIATNDPGTKRLLAAVLENPADKVLIEILKESLASVTSGLKSYANALHKDRHHSLPFAACQKDECVCGRTMIDNAIGIITKASRIEEIDGELEESDYDDGHDLEDDPDLRPVGGG